MNDTLNTLFSLIHDAVECGIDLRAAAEQLDIVRAQAEQRAIDAAGGDEKALGANEAARKRALIIALEHDDEWRMMREKVAQLTTDRDRIAGELRITEEYLRAERWQIRARLADALRGERVIPEHGRPGDDSGFDAAQDEAATALAEEELPF